MKFIRIGRPYINVDSITAIRNEDGEYANHRTKVYSNLREGFDLILEYNAETGEYLNYNNKDYNIE